eukprot:TRINITY_DN5931_c1_g1_i2.p2 TRINITY_DN5931_c1_g1~~TRINITY_DN5931_c1_g1_i2.p2  ORF type:complete len:131 (-),score=11.87 TRINITY_DN5931_c1_g1_i2:268-660(-)
MGDQMNMDALAEVLASVRLMEGKFDRLHTSISVLQNRQMRVEQRIIQIQAQDQSGVLPSTVAYNNGRNFASTNDNPNQQSSKESAVTFKTPASKPRARFMWNNLIDTILTNKEKIQKDQEEEQQQQNREN